MANVRETYHHLSFLRVTNLTIRELHWQLEYYERELAVIEHHNHLDLINNHTFALIFKKINMASDNTATGGC